MLTFEIPVIARMYLTPSLKAGRMDKRQKIEWGLLTRCVCIIIVSSENKQLSSITKLLISDKLVSV